MVPIEVQDKPVPPAEGSVFIESSRFGVLVENNPDTQYSTASTIKLLTALVFLEKYPLSTTDDGFEISFDAVDVSRYQRGIAEGESLVRIENGTVLSQRQVLEALLIDSANNMADKIARYTSDSIEDFVALCNDYAKRNGLQSTIITDPSGFDPGTKSTARDMAKLAKSAYKDPLIRDIVSEKSTNLPVAGEILNTNRLLGISSINGIKTGYTAVAGSAFILSAENDYHTITGAIMGQPTRTGALDQTAQLAATIESRTRVVSLFPERSVVGTYKTPWGDSVDVVVSTDVSPVVYTPSPPALNFSQIPITSTDAGQVVGVIRIDNVTVNLVLASELKKPPYYWQIANAWRGLDLARE